MKSFEHMQYLKQACTKILIGKSVHCVAIFATVLGTYFQSYQAPNFISTSFILKTSMQEVML